VKVEFNKTSPDAKPRKPTSKKGHTMVSKEINLSFIINTPANFKRIGKEHSEKLSLFSFLVT
jgi:hypothetical protein